MNTRLILFFTLLLVIGMPACSNNTPSIDDGNGIYYWRTTLTLTDNEREFISKHKLAKMYVRFFDVDYNWDAPLGKEITPNATILFEDSLPDGLEIIPTIYITTDAIGKMQLKEAEYADKILKRVNAMCNKHGLTFKELQLDCDWTKTTRDYFFHLCEEMKNRLDSTQSLSSTIRLHQLIQTPPPVDKGVLMVYNTGNLMQMTTENSIFSRKDIAPYLKDNRLANYNLPLDVAYPAYGWSVVFHPGRDTFLFYKLLKRTDFADFPDIRKIDDNLYEATESVNFDPENSQWFDVYKGYRIRVERPTADEILEIKYMIERQLKDKPHSTILYHLDESQLSHFSNNEINKIYHRN